MIKFYVAFCLPEDIFDWHNWAFSYRTASDFHLNYVSVNPENVFSLDSGIYYCYEVKGKQEEEWRKMSLAF